MINQGGRTMFRSQHTQCFHSPGNEMKKEAGVGYETVTMHGTIVKGHESKGVLPAVRFVVVIRQCAIA
jgi:hypothetical protein